MQKSSLTALARQQLELAHAAPSGRSSSTTSTGGHEHQLRQTLIALTAGQALSEHENPGEATVRRPVSGGSGSAPAAPPGKRSRRRPRSSFRTPGTTCGALEDAAVLLTVAKHQ